MQWESLASTKFTRRPPRSREEQFIALQSIAREARLLTIASYFHALEQYAAHRRRHTHLRRCAVVLKHQVTRKVVTRYFVAWLSNLQRSTSDKAGRQPLSKIVVLRGKSAFIQLGRTYLLRWAKWIRHLRQRKATNTRLLEHKNHLIAAGRALATWRNHHLHQRATEHAHHVAALAHQNAQLREQLALLQAQCADLESRNSDLAAQLTANAAQLAHLEDQHQHATGAHARQVQALEADLARCRATTSAALHRLLHPASDIADHDGHTDTHTDNNGDDDSTLLAAASSATAALTKIANTIHSLQHAYPLTPLRETETAPPRTATDTWPASTTTPPYHAYDNIAADLNRHVQHLQHNLAEQSKEITVLRSAVGDGLAALTTDVPGLAALQALEEGTPRESCAKSVAMSEALKDVCAKTLDSVRALEQLVGADKEAPAESGAGGGVLRLVHPLERKLAELENAVAARDDEVAAREDEVAKLCAAVDAALRTVEHPASSGAAGQDAAAVAEALSGARELAARGNDGPQRLLAQCEEAARGVERMLSICTDAQGDADTEDLTVAELVAKLAGVVVVQRQDVAVLAGGVQALVCLVRDCNVRLGYVASGFFGSSGVVTPAQSVNALERARPFVSGGSDAYLRSLLGSCVSDAAVRDQLVAAVLPLACDGAAGGCGPAAGALADVRQIVGELYDGVVAAGVAMSRCEDLYVEQKELAESECEAKERYRAALRQSAELLAGAFGGDLTGAPMVPGSDADEMASGVATAEEAVALTGGARQAATALKDLKELFEAMPIVAVGRDSGAPTGAAAGTTTISDCGMLVAAARQAATNFTDLSALYKDMCRELQRSVARGHRREEARSPTSSMVSTTTDLATEPNVIVNAVKAHIETKGKEVKELQTAIREGIKALGGDDPLESSCSTSVETVSPLESATTSAMIGSKLKNLCNETGESITGVREALGISSGGKLTLAAVVPQLKTKMAEVEVVKRESAAMMNEMNRVLNDDPLNSSTSSMRSLKPKKKPMKVTEVVSTFELQKKPAKHPKSRSRTAGDQDVANAMAELAKLSPEEAIKRLRRQIRDKMEEIQDLKIACNGAVSILDGSYHLDGGERKENVSYGQMLLPQLLTQMEDLKLAVESCRPYFGEGDEGAKPKIYSVGTRLHALVGMISTARTERDALKNEVESITKQRVHLMDEFEEETARMRRENEKLRRELEECRGAVARLSGQRVRLRCSLAETLRCLNGTRRAAPALWAWHRAAWAAQEVVARAGERGTARDRLVRCAEALARERELGVCAAHYARWRLGGARRRRERAEMEVETLQAAHRELSASLVAKQHEQNVLAYCVARYVAAWPGPGDVGDALPALEAAVLRRVHADGGESLVRWVTGRVDSIEAARSRLPVLRAELMALRDGCRELRGAVAQRVGLEVADVAGQLLRGAVARAVEEEASAKALRDEERAILRLRALDREKQVKLNAELKKANEAQRETISAYSDMMLVKERHIAALQGELRDLKINAVCEGFGSEGGPAGAAEAKQRRDNELDRAALEREMIARAKELTMKAVMSLVGKDVAVTVGEVAEGMLEVHRRTMAAMQDVCASYESLRDAGELVGGAGRDASRLQGFVDVARRHANNLRRLRQVSDGIVERLPELLRTPYTM